MIWRRPPSSLRTFVDRIKEASYGYAGFFDAVRINKGELEKIYAYDLALLENAQKISAGGRQCGGVDRERRAAGRHPQPRGA